MAKRNTHNLIANPPTGLQISNGKSVSRVTRSPQYPFHIRQRAFDITPFHVSLMLPGESLTNILWQSRAITKPVNSSIIGWWLEHYFFIVPLRALDIKNGDTVYEDMLLDIEAPVTDDAAANSATFHPANAGHDYLAQAYDLIVAKYFRDEGEPVDTSGAGANKRGDFHLKKWNTDSFMDSFHNRGDIADVTVDVNATPTPDNFSVEDLDGQYSTWLLMRNQGLTHQSFEDYQATFGVKVKQTSGKAEPEVVRYTRAFQYPSNTIDPSDGSPTSAVSWSIQERADKVHFAQEPSLLVGLTCLVPKMYLQQESPMVCYFKNALDFLPAVLADRPQISVKEFAAATGPLKDSMTGDAYLLDMRDALLYGESFYNVDPVYKINLPADADRVDNGYFAGTYTDIDALWVDATNNNDTARQDGIVSLSVKGTQIDYT